MFRVGCLILFLGFAYAKHELYDGYALYEVDVKNVKEAEFIELLERQLHLDIWSKARPSRTGNILVPKLAKDEFEVKLKAAGIKHKVAVENIKEFLELEDRLLAAASNKSLNITKDGLPFDRVYYWDQIDAYLDLLGQEYSNTVTVVNAGNSVEGRPIKYLRISTTNFQDTSKPIVYIQSLLHAREWITQAATLYAIHKLVIDISVSEQDLLTGIDWIIAPVVNPDGFVYTHTESVTLNSRLWRKNRASGFIIGDLCRGVDLNRNFDFMWSEASGDHVCYDTFHGTAPFSEPETGAVRNILAEYGDRIELFLDIHSFGSWILYGYGNGNLPPNAPIINLVGVQMAQAIDAVKEDFNPDYVVGNVAMILYEASGSAADYAMSIGIPLTYTFELPGFRFGGMTTMGFLVDPDFVEQAGFETWQGIKVGARYARNSYRTRKGYNV